MQISHDVVMRYHMRLIQYRIPYRFHFVLTPLPYAYTYVSRRETLCIPCVHEYTYQSHRRKSRRPTAVFEVLYTSTYATNVYSRSVYFLPVFPALVSATPAAHAMSIYTGRLRWSYRKCVTPGHEFCYFLPGINSIPWYFTVV